jgi:hypothetical protein
MVLADIARALLSNLRLRGSQIGELTWRVARDAPASSGEQ